MNPVKISGATRCLGKPPQLTDEQCGSLHIRDENTPEFPRMVSAWQPTKADLEMLNAGHPILLSVVGTIHPPVAVFVGTSADVSE